jgi:hypothetical protein
MIRKYGIWDPLRGSNVQMGTGLGEKQSLSYLPYHFRLFSFSIKEETK